MKLYKEALLALDTAGTEAAKQNKYTKILHSTEDPQFQELLTNIITWWKLYIKRGYLRDTRDRQTGQFHSWHPTNHDQWKAGVQKAGAELRQYCEMRLTSKKPEWMLMAEKHGWRPPV